MGGQFNVGGGMGIDKKKGLGSWGIYSMGEGGKGRFSWNVIGVCEQVMFLAKIGYARIQQMTESAYSEDMIEALSL